MLRRGYTSLARSCKFSYFSSNARFCQGFFCFLVQLSNLGFRVFGRESQISQKAAYDIQISRRSRIIFQRKAVQHLVRRGTTQIGPNNFIHMGGYGIDSYITVFVGPRAEIELYCGHTRR